MPDTEFWLHALQRDAADFREAVSAETLDQPVPPCPEWNVEALVAHLGRIYRYVSSHVDRGVTDQPERPTEPIPGGAAVLDWFDEQYATLYAKLERLDPASPAFNWSSAPQVVAFWPRRMAHETSIHRWDAQTSTGLAEPIDAALAVDGVDEVLDSFLPGRRSAEPDDRHGVVRLRADDVDDAEWLIRVRGELISILDTDTVFDDEPSAQAAAAGTASDLVLALWGRVPVDMLTVVGDPELIKSLRTG